MMEYKLERSLWQMIWQRERHRDLRIPDERAKSYQINLSVIPKIVN